MVVLLTCSVAHCTRPLAQSSDNRCSEHGGGPRQGESTTGWAARNRPELEDQDPRDDEDDPDAERQMREELQAEEDDPWGPIEIGPGDS